MQFHWCHKWDVVTEEEGGGEIASIMPFTGGISENQ